MLAGIFCAWPNPILPRSSAFTSLPLCNASRSMSAGPSLQALDAHGEDANDHNLPLMYWYAAEPLPTKDINRALQLAESSKIPRMLQFTVRRTAALGTPEAFAAITATLNRVTDDPAHPRRPHRPQPRAQRPAPRRHARRLERRRNQIEQFSQRRNSRAGPIALARLRQRQRPRRAPQNSHR